MTKRPAKTARSSALPQPETFRDTTWDVRILRAREARTAAQALRRGKRATFPTHLAQP